MENNRQSPVPSEAQDSTAPQSYSVLIQPNSYASLGVRAMLKNGDHQSLVIDISRTAGLDSTYNRNMLLVETAWSAMIGQAIAKWANVPYERHI